MNLIEIAHLVLTVLIAIAAPSVAFYVKTTAHNMVEDALKHVDKRLSSFELKTSETLGDHKSHVKESEMRHTANEQRIDYLERQWTALQDRTDAQQRFQHEIVKTQESITAILAKLLEKLG